MAEEKKQIECKDVGCPLKGYWIEQVNGTVKLCFKQPHHGKQHVIKLDLETIEKELSACYSIK